MIHLRLSWLMSALAASLLFAAPTAAQERTVAITFDDLPYQETEEALCDPAQMMAMTRAFVAMLAPLDTHATAFVNEGKVCDPTRTAALPAALNVWADAGIDLGNHTAHHVNIHRITAEAYLADVDAGAPATRAVQEAHGRTLRWFRHPFLFTGETPEKHDAIAVGLAQRGYVVAPVTLDNNDWMFADVYRKAEAAGDAAMMARIGEAYVAHMTTALNHFEPYSAGLTGGREPAQVLLLHANSLNRDWYPKIHALYLARGYRFVPLETALADPIYSHADRYVHASGVSWLHRWVETDGQPIRWEPEPPQWIRDAYNGGAPATAAGVASTPD